MFGFPSFFSALSLLWLRLSQERDATIKQLNREYMILLDEDALVRERVILLENLLAEHKIPIPPRSHPRLEVSHLPHSSAAAAVLSISEDPTASASPVLVHDPKLTVQVPVHVPVHEFKLPVVPEWGLDVPAASPYPRPHKPRLSTVQASPAGSDSVLQHSSRSTSVDYFPPGGVDDDEDLRAVERMLQQSLAGPDEEDELSIVDVPASVAQSPAVTVPASLRGGSTLSSHSLMSKRAPPPPPPPSSARLSPSAASSLTSPRSLLSSALAATTAAAASVSGAPTVVESGPVDPLHTRNRSISVLEFVQILKDNIRLGRLMRERDYSYSTLNAQLEMRDAQLRNLQRQLHSVVTNGRPGDTASGAATAAAAGDREDRLRSPSMSSVRLESPLPSPRRPVPPALSTSPSVSSLKAN